MQNLSAAHRQISASTTGQYRAMATPYRDGTWNHDVSQNIQALLAAITGSPSYRILDLGCGPGRDLVIFRDLGHVVVGLDGCPEFVAMARAVSGCEVWQQDMLAMTLPPRAFLTRFFIAEVSVFNRSSNTSLKPASRLGPTVAYRHSAAD